MMSLCMQLEKIGGGLLREAFWSVFLAEREGGGNKKGLVLKNVVNIQVRIRGNLHTQLDTLH